MRYSFSRYQRLEQQSRDLEQASPMAKPFVILRNPDPDLVTNAWRDFAPGIPVTMAGLIWAVIGVIAGWLASALFGTASLRAARRRPHRKEALHRTVLDEEIHQPDQPPRHVAPQALQQADLPWRANAVEEAPPQKLPQQTV
jgi:hypothetical protein